MRQSRYDTMQVCMGGHMITSAFHRNPEDREAHCSHCGEKTICACVDCGHGIRGDKYVPGFRHGMDFGDDTHFADSIPKFCRNCGEPFPWTRQKMEALNEFAEEESLPDKDREVLRKNAPLIATDNPKSEVAALRVKKIMGKIGEESVPAFRKILVGLATEAAKKFIGL